MAKLIMTKGLPGSGKTMWAKTLLGPKCKRVNKDDLRAMLDNGKWSKNNESFVLAVRDTIIGMILGRHQTIIVDDTNLDPKHEDRLRTLAKLHNAEFQIADFTKIPLETCISRDDARTVGRVGEKVIREMYARYLEPPAPVPPPFNVNLPDCIIVDIDGTVAEADGRGPFEWHRVGEDRLRVWVHNVVTAMMADPVRKERRTDLIFLSGRDAQCRGVTTEWLEGAFRQNFTLFMRPVGDTRRDSIVKREIYNKHIAGKYNVVAIFDDRAQVCRETWDALGYSDRLFRVGRIDHDEF